MKLLAVLAMMAIKATSCAVPTQRVQCGSLTCNATSHTCGPCTASSECYESAMECVAGLCQLAPIDRHFGVGGGVAMVVGFLVCSIAVVGGVGGGGILVPAYAGLLGVPLSTAVAMSQATICGQSLLNVLLLLPMHHPKYKEAGATRPIINYEYLALLLPMSMAGVVAGALGEAVSPDWLRVALLFTLLSFIFVRLVQRTVAQRRAEVAGESLNAGDDGEGDGLLGNEGSPQYPPLWMFVPLLALAILVSSTTLRSHRVGLVGCGTPLWWALIAAPMVLSVVLTLAVHRILAEMRGKSEGEGRTGRVPFRWTTRTTKIFPMISFIAGGAAFMLGIGGGLVLSFLFLEAGLLPEVTSATSGIATLLVASASASGYLLDGKLSYDFALVFVGVGALSTAFGRLRLMRTIRRRGWTFLIVASLAFVMGASMVATAAFGIYETIEIVHRGGQLQFGSVCDG